MSLPTVTGIAEERRKFLARTPTPELFCPVCTAFTNGGNRHECLGSAGEHVASTHKPTIAIHDHKE